MAWQNPNPYQQQEPPSWQGASTGATTSGGGPDVGSVYQQYAGPPQAAQPFAGQTFAQRQQEAVRPQAEYQWSGGQDWYQQPQGGAPKPAGNNYAQQIGSWYQQYLGRDASQGEIQSRLADPGFNASRHQQDIANSAEARAYAQRPQGQQPQMPPGGYQPPQVQAPPGAPRLPSDPRGWNTDNYPKPGWVAQQPSRNPPAGWEASKWNNPNHQTPKYVIGRILSQYAPRTENMDRVVAEIARAYPGARRTGSGDITIPGIGSTDILQAADVGGKAWHFGGQGGGGRDAGGPAGSAGADPYAALLSQLFGGGGYQQGPDPGMMAEMEQLRAQVAQFQAMQQQQAALQQTQSAEQAAAANAQRARGPQFAYY
jgi:hypothetical protein